MNNNTASSARAIAYDAAVALDRHHDDLYAKYLKKEVAYTEVIKAHDAAMRAYTAVMFMPLDD